MMWITAMSAFGTPAASYILWMPVIVCAYTAAVRVAGIMGLVYASTCVTVPADFAGPPMLWPT